MPNRKKEPKQIPIENIRVKLKTRWGIRPKVYVPIIWLLLILLAVFLFLVLPGIRRNGTHLTVHTLPPDAEVIFDGRRLGPSGVEVFAPKGDGELVVRKAGFLDYSRPLQVKGRVFASRLIHRKEDLSITLEPEESYDPVSRGILEFASWAATGPEEGRYAIPSSLTETAREAVVTGDTADSGLTFAGAALASSQDERHLADILRAEAIASTDTGILTAASLEDLVVRIVSYVDSEPSTLGGVAYLSDGERLGVLELGGLAESVSESAAAADAVLADYYAAAPAVRRLSYGPFVFVSIPAQLAPVGDMEVVGSGYNPRNGSRPGFAEVSDFAIAAREVSNAEYGVFLNENPQWSLDNLDNLMEAGLADAAYLKDWTITGPAPGTDNLPVTGVSWYAATAYAEWFTGRFLQGSDFTAALPDEHEWEVAGRLNGIAGDTRELPANMQVTGNADSGRLGIVGMAGNVREWCRNPFVFNRGLFPGQTGDVDMYPSVTVRGGAYIDARLPYPVSVRGSLHPVVTSPVIGFRLVLKPAG